MSVYAIKPNLTIGDEEVSNSFYNYFVDEIETYLDTRRVTRLSSVDLYDPEANDSIVFFNRNDQLYDQHFLSLLGRFKKANASIYPIALDKEYRSPSQIVEKCQSYDIIDNLEVRALTTSNLIIVANDLARIVITRTQPTLVRESMNVFISHRRVDGESLSRKIYEQLDKRILVKAFRDLINVRVGGDAQQDIEKNLCMSDIVLFLDTPRAGESDWIKIEIEKALKLNIPIIWLKFGKDENRISLKIKPADKPHRIFEDITEEMFELQPKIIDEIIHEGFRIARKKAEIALEKLSDLRRLSDDKSINIKWIDKSKMIARIEIPRACSRYYERPITHYVQLYGRNVLEEEQQEFIDEIVKGQFNDGTDHLQQFDTSLILSPNPLGYKPFDAQHGEESISEYIRYIEKLNMKEQGTYNRAVILSGAFPDCEPEFQSILFRALSEMAEILLLNGYRVIFGAHPTFKTIIFNLSEKFKPMEGKKPIKMYVSKYFVTEALIEEDNQYAEVCATEVVEKDRALSLTKMRTDMILDSEAVALICLGGKTRRGGHNPGIDEEIRIAKERGLPVFLIGSVGGRSAEIAGEMEKKGRFTELNLQSFEFNKMLNNSTDYRDITRKLVKKIGI